MQSIWAEEIHIIHFILSFLLLSLFIPASSFSLNSWRLLFRNQIWRNNQIGKRIWQKRIKDAAAIETITLFDCYSMLTSKAPKRLVWCAQTNWLLCYARAAQQIQYFRAATTRNYSTLSKFIIHFQLFSIFYCSFRHHRRRHCCDPVRWLIV